MSKQVTVAGREITPERVLEVVAEIESMGRVRFLRHYGYREASRFALRVNGKSYPSKAVVGVAAGLKPAEFFGGARGAAGNLTRLGFEVRNTATGCLAGRELDSLRRACEKQGLSVGEKPWPRLAVEPTSYFASGSNRPAEIRGLSRAGADIGVVATELSRNALNELIKLAGTDINVFVDSGAFSEVEFADGEFVQVRNIDFGRVLAVYEELAAALGSQLFVVAPDRVGCQATSLVRLFNHREQLQRLHELGAHILVPVQKGDYSQAEFARRADKFLKFQWLPAMPCKKAATTVEELAAFVTEAKPQHVHLLGLGIRNPKVADYVAAAGDSVSLDSCWIAANAGRGKKPRRFTRARDVATTVLATLGVTTVAVSELAIYACHAGAGLIR
tara:strand:+ start:3209 stop:4375 length:1167 start_codon:yes stop_codon:yes gene_type:complete